MHDEDFHRRRLDTPDADGADDLPCVAGLLAGTLALMTGHAMPTSDARVDADTLRRLTARKIVSNLFFLKSHPDVPPGLRHVAARLHARWLAQSPGPVQPGPAHTGDHAPNLH